MTGKKIFLIVVAMLLVCIIFVSSRSLKITKVIDGSTVQLNNGAMVTLLGLDPTDQSEDYLNTLKGKKVIVTPDNSQFFSVKNMRKGAKYPAYLALKKGECINAYVLQNGLSGLNTASPLEDSLSVYKKYAERAAKDNEIKPKRKSKPKIKPKELDYEEDDIILPDYKPQSRQERVHSVWYDDGNMNTQMLEDAVDFNLPYTKQFANKLASKSPGNFNIGQVCEIFDYCFNKWSYVNDPAEDEYVARASESIYASLTGDCDDFAVLMAACILAVGGHPCINTGFNPKGGHAFTEVDISEWGEDEVLSAIRKRYPEYDISSIATRRDGNRLWLNLDWQARYPGGDYYNCSSSRDAYTRSNGQWHWQKLR